MLPITPEYARQLLDYNPDTGHFVWRRRNLRPGFERADKVWNARYAGKAVLPGTEPKGHLYFSLHCKKFKAHRVAWAIVYGEWPASDLDHINGNPADNRISNLRLATQSENNYNSRLRKDNTSGLKGVSWNRAQQVWEVYINANSARVRLGKFKLFSDAAAARIAAAEKYHGSFARTA